MLLWPALTWGVCCQPSNSPSPLPTYIHSAPRIEARVRSIIADMSPLAVALKDKAASAVGVETDKAKGGAAEMSGEAKGKASELAGKAKGKAEEIKGTVP